MSSIWMITKVPRWWLPLLGAGCAATVVLLVLTLAEISGPRPPSAERPAITPLSQEDGAIHLAGMGTWLPLARALAAAYESTHPDVQVFVHESIGSGGGRRAVQDGVIDLGLISTRGGASPAVEGFETLPIARSAVVYAVHPSVSTRSLTSAEALAIFTGRRTTWSDGQTIVPLLRERGDSATRVAASHLDDLAEAIERARFEGRWPTLLTDSDMGRALLTTPGAIGLYDLGAIRLESPSIQPLVLDGVAPDLETLSNGHYPLTRTLVILVSERRRPEVGDFVNFVQSSEGGEVLRRDGAYLPLGAGDG